MSGYDLSDDFVVPAIEVVYRPHVRFSKRPTISSFRSAGRIFFDTWDKGSIHDKQKVRVMLLSKAYQVLGIYELTGDVNAILSDPRKLILPALRTNAVAVCIARTHCSDDLSLDKADEKLLKKAIEIGKMFGIDVWDYVIIGSDRFFSCRQNNMLQTTFINDGLYDQSGNSKADFLKGQADEIDISRYSAEPGASFGDSQHVVGTRHDPNETIVTEHLQHLVDTLSKKPSLLKGRVRRLKIMSATRGYTVQNDLYQDVYMTTSRIYLIGDWIAKTGLNCHDRIKVIPLHRLLIIAPEDPKE